MGKESAIPKRHYTSEIPVTIKKTSPLCHRKLKSKMWNTYPSIVPSKEVLCAAQKSLCISNKQCVKHAMYPYV